MRERRPQKTFDHQDQAKGDDQIVHLVCLSRTFGTGYFATRVIEIPKEI
jgi:hypothetical protein